MGGAQAQPNFRVLLYWCTHPLTQNYQIWRGNSNTYGKKTCYRRSATPPPQGVRRPSASHVGTVARFVSDSCLLCEWSLCVDRCLQICLWGKCLMPWILFRILFKPATIKIFRSWTSEFQYGISAKVSYVNVGIGLCLCLTWIVNVIITRWWVRASRHVTGSVSCYCMPGLASEPQRADHRLGHLASPTCIQVPWPLGDQREGWNTPNMTLWQCIVCVAGANCWEISLGYPGKQIRGMRLSVDAKWLARKTPMETPVSRDYLQKRPWWTALYVLCRYNLLFDCLFVSGLIQYIPCVYARYDLFVLKVT